MLRIGIDVGSTTAKIVVLNADNEIVFSDYRRHHAKAREVVTDMLQRLQQQTGGQPARMQVTGSVGMGFCEQLGLTFIQEVMAATKAIQHRYPQVRTMIDIGGEDAKIVFFENAEATGLRMNGNCAGGTGAFIDQMAVILDVDVTALNELALQSEHTYPIASRCGVFCKTDIQNLIAKNVSKADIAASIFHAVAVQTMVTLAHGCDIHTPVLLCGGPLTFIPALRRAFMDYLHLQPQDFVVPEHSTLLPATGAALACTDGQEALTLEEWIRKLNSLSGKIRLQSSMKPIFSDETDYRKWQTRIAAHQIPRAAFKAGVQEAFLGIDSGSTTTKIVVTDEESRLLFTYYTVNGGNPIEAVEQGLRQLRETCRSHHTELRIKGSCSTGYGEDLIRTAFQLNGGMVETVAHYVAARHLNPDVSFILDIGGQDMKGIFVNGGVINRIEINEACSSGCGSFIETFARTLGYSVQDFAQAACRAKAPCDLGTRCTVFMNSKVKQVLREGAGVEDIAAGLAYSVVKNCLYKVLKIKDTDVLGRHIVVQGGTMRNDAIVRALEQLTGAEVVRCDIPELMGALGCALHARQMARTPVCLDDIIAQAHYTTRQLHCHGCDNQCLVSRYTFDNGQSYHAGNRCEKIFTNGESRTPGRNAYPYKLDLLFKRAEKQVAHPRGTIGMARCLNMYENFPFWHTLLTGCGFRVCLSGSSDYGHYEQSARMVMSDNICFPAKLMHSHIQELIDRRVDRIFLPFVIFERSQKEQNSYNCPIVTGYSEVIKSVQATDIPIDSPAISFKDNRLLYRQCQTYLSRLGVSESEIKRAFRRALEAQDAFQHDLVVHNQEILRQARQSGRFVVMLAGRPYHADPLVQHKISDLIAQMGVDVITDDLVREDESRISEVHYLAQWTYPNRILKAARWCGQQDAGVQFVELTSFGCGPDAFLTDEVRDLLMRHGKPFTLLKMDDINNVGSMKLRVRSLIESLRISQAQHETPQTEHAFRTVPVYGDDFRGRKILVPYFTPFLSPLIPAILRRAGYDVDNLPLSDTRSCDFGLKYANNEVCYPATLIVGDVIRAFKSGQYDPDRCVVAMSQTGGQCRASNYLAIIKKALVDAGYTNTPVISLTFGGTVDSEQPGFKINWTKILPVALRAILYTDCLSKFYYASVVREKQPGQARELTEKYLKEAEARILQKRTRELLPLLARAADEFNAICRDKTCPRVGVVGEIFLKFNPFAQKHATDWLSKQGIEVVPSVMTDFFTQSFVNRKIRVATDIEKRVLPEFLYRLGYKAVSKQIQKANRMAGRFRYFVPLSDIFEEAEEARKVITLNAQFGEGWLLPAEVLGYARQGVKNVISLQPFGCIANHIVSKGVEKRIKQLCPDLNMLSLDFDSGVSDVNITNRMLLFTDNLK